MTYDEIAKLEPRLEYLELLRIDLARSLKREGIFDDADFSEKYIIPTIESIVGLHSGRDADDPLGQDEAYDEVHLHFLEHPEFSDAPTAPKTVVRITQQQNIEDAINKFIKDNVCRLILCRVNVTQNLAVAEITYIPYHE